ncbi:hypothetical protein LAV79_28685 [Peribacillus butanolivorans]|uniref:hypothetical protein n=1 Tax=Peribacillus butanolivorans TaxID=421767 RepID=UPI0030C9A493
MELKKYIIGFSAGYIAVMIIVYFTFDYFSWSYAVGSLTGIVLFALIVKVLRRKI